MITYDVYDVGHWRVQVMRGAEEWRGFCYTTYGPDREYNFGQWGSDEIRVPAIIPKYVYRFIEKLAREEGAGQVRRVFAGDA